MFAKPIKDIRQNDIADLVNNQVAENKSLDYKELLPGGTDADKKEFLADVSSFANASGGHIVFGVEEQRDAAGKSTGIPAAANGLAGINYDSESLRLEAILRTGLSPRIPALEFHRIDGFPNGPVVLLRIARSWLSPHRVTFKDDSRFYSRN